MPEHGLPVVLPDLGGELPPDFPRADGFQRVYQAAWLDVGMGVHQQMSVVGLPVHLHQRAARPLAQAGEQFPQAVEHGRGQNLPAIFRHENYMVEDPKNTVGVRSQLLLFHANYDIIVRMETATRNIVFRLYPTRAQAETLSSWLELHRELYNAALQERRDAYRKSGVSLSYREQQNELPGVKEARPDLVPLGSHALQETVRRVDRAYQAFFRRCRNGEKPGFPRFKGRERFDSFTYPDPAGWKIPEQSGRKGRLHIANQGGIRMRGKPRVAAGAGEVRNLTVRRAGGKWYAVVAVRYAAAAAARPGPVEERPVGLDAGCLNLATTSEGKAVENPKPLGQALGELRTAQRTLSRKRRGSRNRAKAKAKVIRLHERVRNRRRDFLHKLSASFVALFSFIAIENLKLRNMSRSAKGTKDRPGRNVKQKSGLNRSILDAGIGMFFAMLESKAAEAGVQLEKVDPRNTSQRCSFCGELVPKELRERVHRCPHCGFTADRDHNAALNILALGLAQAGPGRAEAWSPALAGRGSAKPPLCLHSAR